MGVRNRKKILRVNQTSCQTSKKGIYGIGDICNYPGKLKLILTGFAEAAAASHHCYNLVFPDKPLHFEYSTTKVLILQTNIYTHPIYKDLQQVH